MPGLFQHPSGGSSGKDGFLTPINRDIAPEEVRMRKEAYLSRETTLRVLAVLRQAERSIDAVLYRSQPVWTALREYYDAERRQEVTAAIATLDCEGLSRNGTDGEWTPKERPSRLRFLVAFAANKWRRGWWLPAHQRCFLARSLQDVLKMLGSVEQPAHDELVQLRLHLTCAVSFLEDKLCGVPELDRIYDVEHFAPPPWQRLYPLREIVG
jgi:hypothetical protein